ncbi:lasso RiPP family leader peptide-containing protein [Methylacidimicrobium sp. B4]|uniref:lasso RiPP family leader peptide-containing protein n=1 Tax=Methylacidimicrobium sp. B4 TaxID=2796139 RepID=UPI001A8FDFE7|nr:lasso RiPP family leader peptide-containing protein [Methylacidimicrobium sp. B4]QSR85441.1 lasso RiPP family leader peptide-containing protein [Methylacidimicrobium sp. B4]
MKNENGMPERNQKAGEKRRKPYEAPKLIVHGSVEELTKNSGVLLTDTLLTGSIVSTATVLG